MSPPTGQPGESWSSLLSADDPLGGGTPGASSPASRWSLVPLVAANLVPLAGAVFAGWDVFTILWLFWMENLVVGGFNVLRMLTSRGAFVPGQSDLRLPAVGKLFLAAFFAVHYGGFCLGHGAFLLAVFGKSLHAGHGLFSAVTSQLREELAGASLLALTLSHGFSYARNFIIGGERDRTSLPALMFTPYGRIVVMHITVMIGAALVVFTGRQGPILLAALVGLKILVDTKSHIWEHSRLARPGGAGGLGGRLAQAMEAIRRQSR
jgi:hypothetical protein